MAGERLLLGTPGSVKPKFSRGPAAARSDDCSVNSAASIFVVRAVQRLQEIDTEKREPILLRCSAVQHATRVIRIDTLQRTSKFYDILHEFHSPVTQALYRLVPSAETDEGAVRYLFASASGRSTRIHLRCSPTYTIHWHVISPSKELQVKRRAVSLLSYELLLRPMEPQTAERWHMNWEYVLYRVSHGVHFAVKQSIADISPQQSAQYVHVQKAYARRFVRSIIAPIQKKKVLKRSEPNPIFMRTVDCGEPCFVKTFSAVGFSKFHVELLSPARKHVHQCPANSSSFIRCSCCCCDSVQN